MLSPRSSGDESAGATPNAAFTRGRIIHRLLQSIPSVSPDKRAESVRRFLHHHRQELSPDQRAEIAHEVSQLLADDRLTKLFAADSLVEAPVAGLIRNSKALRQVDRLCFVENEVWIVDYKTNRPPPRHIEDAPVSYKKQLEEYRSLVAALYPGRKIRCFLLWTCTPVLMEL
jgi:ATP-dependent helicase/nuclease subunit A